MSIVFIISAPSGSGKSTLVSGLLKLCVKPYFFNILHDKATPGEGTAPDRITTILVEAEFEERIARGEFLEYAEVFGNYYGTHRSVFEKAERDGLDVVLDIDVQGARQLEESDPGCCQHLYSCPFPQDSGTTVARPVGRPGRRDPNAAARGSGGDSQLRLLRLHRGESRCGFGCRHAGFDRERRNAPGGCGKRARFGRFWPHLKKAANEYSDCRSYGRHSSEAQQPSHDPGR